MYVIHMIEYLKTLKPYDNVYFDCYINEGEPTNLPQHLEVSSIEKSKDYEINHEVILT